MIQFTYSLPVCYKKWVWAKIKINEMRALWEQKSVTTAL